MDTRSEPRSVTIPARCGGSRRCIRHASNPDNQRARELGNKPIARPPDESSLLRYLDRVGAPKGGREPSSGDNEKFADIARGDLIRSFFGRGPSIGKSPPKPGRKWTLSQGEYLICPKYVGAHVQYVHPLNGRHRASREEGNEKKKG